VLEKLQVSFEIRWKKGHYFYDVEGVKKKLWQIGRGKKYLAHKEMRDLHTGQKMPCDIWWAPVRHEAYTQQLSLVRVRAKNEVMYIVTNVRVKTEAQAWEIVFAYRRRWQIELAFRYNKSELALESPIDSNKGEGLQTDSKKRIFLEEYIVVSKNSRRSSVCMIRHRWSVGPHPGCRGRSKRPSVAVLSRCLPKACQSLLMDAQRRFPM
jgi:hypothetical protein